MNTKNELSKSQEEISTYESLVFSLENKNNEKLKVLQDKNEELERQVNSGSSYLRDQNETLLQEIRRLKAEMAEMSIRK